ncbi:HsdM family class I SAM-dependent methyltransferase [Bacillus subtilis]|uniref:HsdM family class I SAM-dependent methyltransferase n=1 Tax=Bacillus subtilis TaxID=1423 RepID=UPI00089DEBFB|nr:N-6 DNA methylase [Bacillus subtilis]AOY05582.1 restriction endonuclease subunit M [Bacillus subtilis]
MLKDKKNEFFVVSKQEYDVLYSGKDYLEKSLVPVDGKIIADIPLKNQINEPNEEYYKWQFIYAILHSNLYNKENIGVEIYLPKGNKDSKPIKIDGCIFDDEDWIHYYKKWRNNRDYNAVEWLSNHIIGIMEFKKSDGKDIKKVFSSQVKSYLKAPDTSYCLGIYYDTERLYLFHKTDGKIIRYDDSKNQKGVKSGTNDLTLELSDPYHYLPSFNDLVERTNVVKNIDRANRTIKDLFPITGVNSKEINSAMLEILRTLDSVGLVNQRGYEIIIETLAIKIRDEKRNVSSLERNVNDLLKFYISEEELQFNNLGENNIQQFISRMEVLYEDAQVHYPTILRENIDWARENHIKVVISVVKYLQDYTFILSEKTDINQLVFYQFASKFAKDQQAQFVTPLTIGNFMVDICNPRDNDTVIDPTVGIADFLSSSYIRSGRTLDSGNLFGVDIDEQMVMLAELNMLLSGVNEDPVLLHKPGYGSLLYKFNSLNELVELQPENHKNGNWDNWKDGTKLKKFSVSITNPPFGENRKFKPVTKRDQEVAELYELWETARSGDWIDPGLLFLENTYRILDTNGRMAFVVSNSISSIDRWKEARDWLIDKMRIVAIFDLPENVFAETGVNTSIIVAYKPAPEKLVELKENNYEFFSREIKNVGYEVRTSNRIKFYSEEFKIDNTDFKYEIDEYGQPVLNEDFSGIVKEFRKWIVTQEKELKDIFLS